MPRHDRLATVLDELATLPAASRRAILRGLSPQERTALAAHPGARPRIPGPDPSPSPFSPWLLARIDAIRAGDMLDPAAARMTSAARQAVLHCADAVVPTSHAAVPKGASGKSLFDTITTRIGRS